VVEEDAVVPKPMEASREATELAAAELTVEPTTGEVPGSEAPAAELASEAAARDTTTPEAPAAKRSTEPSDVPTTETAEVTTRETATPKVSTAKAPAAVTPSDGERDAAIQGERQDDGEAKGEKVTTGRRQRPMIRRELHGRSLVASPGWVKGGAAVQERPALARCGLCWLHCECREAEQADELHDQECEALIPSQARRGSNMDYGLAEACEEVEDREAVERMPCHTAHRRKQHDAGEEG